MPKNPNPEFNLDHQYRLYLQRVGLDEATMPEEQNRQLKQAFMGATGQMLVMFRDEITKFPDAVAVMIMEDLWRQVGKYWNSFNRKDN